MEKNEKSEVSGTGGVRVVRPVRPVEPCFLTLRLALYGNREMMVYAPRDFNLEDLQLFQKYLKPFKKALQAKAV